VEIDAGDAVAQVDQRRSGIPADDACATLLRNVKIRDTSMTRNAGDGLNLAGDGRETGRTSVRVPTGMASGEKCFD
jgi:hypothetical protein